MSVTLIIFIAFQFDGGVAAQSVKFENMPLCELARKQVLAEISKIQANDGWGRKRIVAQCVFTGKGGEK